MPEDLKLSQIGSSPLPPSFRGLHSPGVRKHCQRLFSTAAFIQGTSLSRSTKTLSNYLRLLFPDIVFFYFFYYSIAATETFVKWWPRSFYKWLKQCLTSFIWTSQKQPFIMCVFSNNKKEPFCNEKEHQATPSHRNNCLNNTKSAIHYHQEHHSSGAAWESRWSSWAVRSNEPSGFRGGKDLLNRASALVTTCP